VARWHDLRRRLADDTGQGETASWLLLQVPFWFLVTLVIVIGLVGLRQAGAASLAHLAARRAGTATLPAGQAVAHRHGEVWRVPGTAAQLSGAPAERAVRVRWAFTWQARTLGGRLVGPFDIEVQEHARREGFYGGPPAGWD
jgi:hypothetical protein